MKPEITKERIRQARQQELGPMEREGVSTPALRGLEAVLDKVSAFEAPAVPEHLKLTQVRAALAQVRPSGIRARAELPRVRWLVGAVAVAAAAAVVVFLRSQPRGDAVLGQPAGDSAWGPSVARVISGEISAGNGPATRLLLMGEQLEITGEQSAELQLKDGSRVTAAAHSRFSVQRRAVDLITGRVSLEVERVPGGQGFVVATPEAKVHVVGTHFSVQRESARSGTLVQVTAGIVDVEARQGGERRRLRAGEGWKIGPVGLSPSAPQPASDQQESQPAPTVEAVPTVPSSAKVSLAPGAKDTKTRASEALRAAEDLVAQGRFSEAINSYERLAASFPGTPQSEMARFAAASLATDHAPPERAERLLNRYLGLYPNGSFAPQARKLLQRLPKAQPR